MKQSGAHLGHAAPDQESIVQRIQLLALRQLIRRAHLHITTLRLQIAAWRIS